MSIKYIKSIKTKTPIDILIPAAGLGKRMKSYGPKPLIKIKKDISIIDNQLKIINKLLPAAKIILVCGFEAEYLMYNTPNDIFKIENENYETTNVVRSIGMGLRVCTNDVLIVYGDLVFNEACINTLNYNKSSILVSNIMDESEVGCTINKEKYLEYMMYDLSPKWGQMLFIKGRELKLMKDIAWNKNNYNLFGFEAINKILEYGGKFITCSNSNAKMVDIDTSKDLEKVKEII